ncbi:MAG TPA: GatB/YqeY domain-containing protein [Polyangiaceae bacterium]|nr:GatB/YqeY domain-containing protein [Polyangiaceae bacterium]
MLVDEIKARMFRAMKAGNTVEKEILRVAVGEITTEAAREGRRGDDDEARAIVRKLIKSNDESLASGPSEDRRAVLEQENRILADFLPKSLGVDDIVRALEPVHAALKSAGNEGQATGVAMKHLKAAGATVNGKDVAEAVKRVRSG